MNKSSPNKVDLQVGKKYLTFNKNVATIVSKTNSGYLANLSINSVSDVATLEYTPDGRAITYNFQRKDNDIASNYDIEFELVYNY